MPFTEIDNIRMPFESKLTSEKGFISTPALPIYQATKTTNGSALSISDEDIIKGSYQINCEKSTIGKLHFKEGELHIEMTTTMPLHLELKTSLLRLDVITSSKVYLKGIPRAFLNCYVKAHEIEFLNEFNCDGSVTAHASNKVNFAGNIEAQFITVKAPHIEQSAILRSEQTIFHCHTYRHLENAKTKSRLGFNVHAQACEISGELETNQMTRIYTGALVLGNNISASTMIIKGWHSIKANYMLMIGDTQLLLMNEGNRLKPIGIKIRDKCMLSENVVLELRGSSLSSNKVINKGDLISLDSILRCDTLKQKHFFTLKRSYIEAASHFKQSGDSLTHAENSDLCLNTLQAVKGHFEIKRTQLKASDIYLKKLSTGTFSDGSSIYVSGDLCLSGNGGAQFDHTTAKVLKTIVLHCNTRINESTLYFHQLDLHHQIIANRSKFICCDKEGTIEVLGNVTLSECQAMNFTHVRVNDDSNLRISKGSIVKTGEVIVFGKLKLVNSAAKCDWVFLIKGNIACDNSALEVVQSYRSFPETLSKIVKNTFIKTKFLNQQGKLIIADNSQIDVLAHAFFLPSCIVRLKRQGMLQALHIHAQGIVKLENSLVISSFVTALDRLSADNGSRIKTEFIHALPESTTAITNESTLEAKCSLSWGTQSISESIIFLEETGMFMADSSTHLEGSSKLIAKNWLLLSKLTTESQHLKQSPAIIANDSLSILISANLSGTDLSVHASQFFYSGNSEFSGSFIATGKYACLLGDISASELIDLKFTDQTLNFGALKSENISIRGDLINMFGYIRATRQFNHVGILGFNLFGAIQARNLQQSTFFNFNAGFKLPYCSLSPDELFSFRNLLGDFEDMDSFQQKPLHKKIWSCIKSAAPIVMSTADILTSMTPSPWSTTLRLPLAIPGILCSAANTYAIGRRLLDKKANQIEWDEWIEAACSLKNLTTGLMATHQTGTALWNNRRALKTTKLRLHGEQFNGSTLARMAANALGGGHVNNSFINAQFGVSFSQNSTTSALLHSNFGLECVLQSQSLNALFLQNSGYQIGFDQHYSFYFGRNSGDIHALNQLNFVGNSFINDSNASLSGTNVFVDLKSMRQRGLLHLSNGVVNIVHYSDDAQAKSKMTNLQSNGKAFDLNGSLQAENTFFEYTDRFHTSETSLLNIKNTLIKTESYQHAGSLHYSGKNQIQAKKSTFKKGSLVQGERTVNDSEAVFQEQSTANASEQLDPVECSSSEVSPVLGSEQSGEAYTADQVNAEQNVDTVEKDEKPENSSASNSKGIKPRKSRKKAWTRARRKEQQCQDKSSEETPAPPEMESQQATPVEDISLADDSVELVTAPDETTQSAASAAQPEHMLIISSEQTSIAGKMAGGDYVIFEGHHSSNVDEPPRVQSLIFEKTADVELENGAILSESTEYQGKVSLNQFYIDSKHTEIRESADLNLSHSHYLGDQLRSSGSFKVSHCYFELSTGQFDFGSEVLFKDSYVKMRSLTDCSQLYYDGSVILDIEEFTHRGNIHSANPDGDAQLYLKLKNHFFDGSAELGNVHFNLENCVDYMSLLAGNGAYANYKISGVCTFESERNLMINSALGRECDFVIIGKSIDVTSAQQGDYKLSLFSTEGDVMLASDIKIRQLYVNSSKRAVVNSTLEMQELSYIFAQDAFYNYGGSILAKTLLVDASTIYNITLGSSRNGELKGIKCGKGGLMHGDSEAYFISREGSVENWGGYMSSNCYLEIDSAKDILLMANVNKSYGRHGIRTNYTAAVMRGGSGTEDSNGFGLCLNAKGKIKSEAGCITSEASNYLSAEQGIELKDKHHVEITRDETKRSGFLNHRKKRVVQEETKVARTVVHSESGRNVMVTKEGGVASLGSLFVSKGGTDIFSRKKVSLKGIKTTLKQHVTEKSCWGLNKSKRKEYHEDALYTEIFDDGESRIHCYEEAIELDGIQAYGNGTLEVASFEDRVIFGNDKRQHKVSESKRSIGVTLPGSQLYQIAKSSTSPLATFNSHDPLLRKIDAYHRGSLLEQGCSVFNTALEGVNTANSVARGLASTGLGNEALARYGLGDTSASIRFTTTKQTTNYQTSGNAGVNRGGAVKIKSAKGVELNDGVGVHSDIQVEIDAPELTMNSQTLKHSQKTESSSISVRMELTGQISGGSLESNRSKMNSTTHQNATITSQGEVYLHHNGEKMDTVTLNGANIDAKKVNARIGTLNITDQQDQLSYKSEGGSLDSSGNVSWHKSHGQEKHTTHKSGIHAQEGLNTKGGAFEVDTLNAIGGAITTDGENCAAIGTVNSTSTYDESFHSSKGFAINLSQVSSSFFGTSTPSNVAGGKAIGTATISSVYSREVTEQSTVIHGAEGSEAKLTHVNGNICQDTSDGRRVVEQSSQHIEIDVPLASKQDIQQVVENFAGAKASLFPARPVSPVASVGKESENREELVCSEMSAHQVGTELEQSIVDEIKEELDRNGDISEQSMSELCEKLNEIGVDAAKNVLDSLAGLLKDSIDANQPGGQIGKGAMNYLQLVYTVGLNVYKNSGQVAAEQVISEALKDTAVDCCVGLLSKGLFGAAAGPIAWTGFVVTALDTLSYNKEGMAIDQERTWQLIEMLEQSSNSDNFYVREHISEMEDNFFERQGTLEVWHAFAEGFRSIPRFFKWAFNSALPPNDSATSEPKAGMSPGS